jgi:hypothetical protein
MAAAVIHTALATDSRAPLLRAVAQQGSATLIKTALAAGVPADAAYPISNGNKVVDTKLPLALFSFPGACQAPR